MNQIYHHYSEWEDFKAGMWNTLHGAEAEICLKKAIEFTGDARLYGLWMMRVIDQWPISCEVNLTNGSINQRAWIGHAACCLSIGCPESITRQAWHHLSDIQQMEANAQADIAIRTWKSRKGIIECQNSDSARLF